MNRSSHQRIVNLALVAFTTALSLATVATAAIALAGCSGASASDGQRQTNETSEGTGSSIIASSTTKVMLSSASGVEAAPIVGATCVTAIQTYTVDRTAWTMTFAICPSDGPSAQMLQRGSFTLADDDRATMSTALDAIDAWPVAAGDCSADGIGYAAVVTDATATAVNYDDAAGPCTFSNPGYYAAHGIKAAFDQAADIVAAELAAVDSDAGN